MTLLHYLGQESMMAFTSREAFHMGYGTHYNHVMRAAKAICSLHDQVVFWPNEEERKQISARMKENHDYPGCVMVGDGTLFPMDFEPRSHDSGNYHGRKFKYSITAFIMNDERKRIRSYLAGWSGSVHDNRILIEHSGSVSPSLPSLSHGTLCTASTSVPRSFTPFR